MSLKLKQLDVFIATVRTGTATAAAETLHMTQPNITKILRQLEESFGLSLFDRKGGRLIPTAEADMLYRLAERIHDDARHFEHVAHSLGRLDHGYLRIATQPSFSNAVVPRAAARFRSKHPRIRLRIDVLPNEAIFKLSDHLPIDFAFVHFFGSPEPEYVTETLASMPLICLVPEGHALARKSTVSIDDVFANHWIGFPPDHATSRLLRDGAPREGQERFPDIMVSSVAAARDLVRQGAGIAVVDSFSFLGEAPAGVVQRPLRPRLIFKTGLAVPTGRPISKAGEAFLAEVSELLPARNVA